MGIKEIDKWGFDRLITREGRWDTDTIFLILCLMENRSPDASRDLNTAIEYARLIEVACSYFLTAQDTTCDYVYLRQQNVNGLQKLLDRVLEDQKTFISSRNFYSHTLSYRYRNFKWEITLRRCIKKILDTKKTLESPECVRLSEYR